MFRAFLKGTPNTLFNIKENQKKNMIFQKQAENASVIVFSYLS